ncbi:MAG: phosphate regulon sensor histidine kinase PhoR [Burkholderiales bacterium]|jgi:two-component system phosphate regulon sensor histidine kinase PhoR
MKGILPSVFWAIVLCGFGSLLGGGLGLFWKTPTLGVFFGSLLAVAFYALRQSLRAQSFLRWLKDTHGPAPRHEGFWGEIGYLTEKALRALERSVVQERLQRSQFLSGIEASPNGVMLLNQNDQIEWCNLVCAEHFNLHRDQDIHQTVTNLIRSPVFVAYMQEGIFDSHVLFGGAGGRRKLMVLVRPYGEGMKLLLSQDVTERERNDAMRRDFVANVSHEIRTPLTVLSGFIETMRSMELSAPEMQRVIMLMNQQAQRMESLVTDLLILAQLEGSPPPPPDCWFDVHQIIQRVQADAIALSAGRHRLSFVGATDFEIAGSESEIQSALTNLVTNAVRYTPDGGMIRVQIAQRNDGEIEIEVKDSGVGIEKDHIPRLTERFYRVDGSRSRETGGTGLGLSIVNHVVQRHHAQLQIESEVGKGSIFRLIFPASRIRIAVENSEGPDFVQSLATE